MMAVRFGILFLFVLGFSWACDARQLEAGDAVISQASVVQMNQGQDAEIKEIALNDNVCTLCEEYVTEAIDYLSQKETQAEVVALLHLSCSRVQPFEKQCITLVDYYVPLFFKEISLVQPQVFCDTVNLCEKVVQISSQIREDSCGVCRRTISEVLTKLKDPDTQMEIIELLLKGCKSVLNFETKCKKIVLEYGPLILANTEKILETTDVCTILHVCNDSKQASLVQDS